MVLQPILKVKEEERKFGVFYDDDYNYLQHLKDRGQVDHDWSEADRFVLERQSGSGPAAAEGGGGGQVVSGEPGDSQPAHSQESVRVSGVQLPSAVFASKGEQEEVGLLNKAAPRGLDLSLDPDIVAAMDEDFNFDDPDNALDDDFVAFAMGEGGGADENSDEYDGDASDEEEDWETDSDCMGGRSDDEEEFDEVPELQAFDEEETRTKFTNYSMSSSIIRRNKELSLLDDKFERFMDQYGELEEGALDGEEIEGALDGEGSRMEQLLEETMQERK